MSIENALISVTKSLNETRQKIAARAFSDNEFRERLLADPRVVLATELGIPEKNIDIKDIHIVEEQPGVLTIPIPPSIDDIELSEEDLKKIAGGLEKGGHVSSWKPPFVPDWIEAC